MGLIALVLYWLLEAYFFALIGRFIIDLILSFSRSWRPKGIVVALVESIYTITDPPLKLVRKVVPPIRLGAIQLDFGWTLVLLAVLFVQGLVRGLV
jgi:YggT family protein